MPYGEEFVGNERTARSPCWVSFTLWQAGHGAAAGHPPDGRSGRLWTLVAYLHLQQEKGATTQELIDILWPEAESANPASTLQNNASRARAALEALGLQTESS